MTDLRWFFCLLALAAFLPTTSGCAVNRWCHLNDELARDSSGLHKESGQAIVGYQLNNGTDIMYDGWVRQAAQDSLVFWTIKKTEAEPQKEIMVKGPRLPMNEVIALKIQKISSEKTYWLVSGLIMAPIAYSLLTMETTGGSGPSW